MDHRDYMAFAIKEAQKGACLDEVPIGAILVHNNQIIASAHNQTIQRCDPTAHAEILVLREAADHFSNYRLLNTTLYVTIEPCIMCMGAILHARIHCLVFGAPDIKWGACGSLYNFSNDSRLNHSVHVVSGIMENECRAIIQHFFHYKRKKQTMNLS